MPRKFQPNMSQSAAEPPRTEEPVLVGAPQRHSGAVQSTDRSEPNVVSLFPRIARAGNEPDDDPARRPRNP
jgi:hypothetical protein